MKRDMELIRKILLAIEEQYIDSALFNLKIDDYDFKTVAYHCKILYDAKMVNYYKPIEADDGIYGFSVSNLSWDGHEFLDKIRDDTVWGRTKETMKEKGIPFALDTVIKIASTIVDGMTQAAIKSIMP